MNKSEALSTLTNIGRYVDVMPGSELHRQDIDLLIARLEAIIMTTWDSPAYLIDEFRMLCATLTSLVYNSKVIEGDEFIIDMVEDKLSSIIMSIQENARSEVQ